MKLRKIFIGTLILGMGLSSSPQLFATCFTAEKLAPTTLSTVQGAASSVAFAEAEYKELFYKTLKDYLNIDANKLPKDAVFNVTIEDRKSINEENAKALAAQKQSLDKKIISQSDYQIFKEQIEQHKNDTYDRICCTLSSASAKGLTDEISDDDGYTIIFASDTKQVLLLQVPLSAEGLKILADETAAKVSSKDLQNKYANFIKTHKIGGITNPKCITNKVENANKEGDIPVLIYQDQKDTTKKVTIAVDSANGNINYIYVW